MDGCTRSTEIPISTILYGKKSVLLPSSSCGKDELLKISCVDTDDLNENDIAALRRSGKIAGRVTQIPIDEYDEDEDRTFTEIITMYREKGQSLFDCCDMMVFSELTKLHHMRAAVLSARKAEIPSAIIMDVDEEGNTVDGTNAMCALIVLQELGISAFGVYCENLTVCADIIAQLAPFAKIPLAACVESFDGEGDQSEIADKLERVMMLGAAVIGLREADSNAKAILKKAVTEFPFESVHIEKQDTSLVFATENQRFFLEPDTTEFSPPIECEPDMADVIGDVCDESYDVLTVRINSPDDAIDFCRNMHMATLPASFLSEDEISLKMALMLYDGKAIIDTGSLIERETLERIAKKYGAVLY